MRLIALIILFSLQAVASPYEFDLKPSQKIVAIGDLHGDSDAMLAILKAMKLINAEAAWVGGDSHLVFLGDMIDRGDNGRQVMDIAMRLEKEAAAAGGAVHSILGNHELIVTMGQTDYASKKDLKSYEDFAKPGDQNSEDAFVRAFQENSVYAKWYRSRPAMIRINDNLFVHGGVTQKMGQYSLTQINQGVLAWFKYYQNVSKRPETSTHWMIGERGPLWNRYLTPGENKITSNELNTALKHFLSNRVVVGHTVVDNLIESFHHADFDGRVYMIDTGISYVYDGKQTALVLKDGYVYSYKILKTTGEPTLKRKRKLTRRDCKSLLDNTSAA